MRTSWLVKLMGFWPPYWGAGIRVLHVSDDLTRIEVAMRLRFWNRNYVGTHFGGSLYSMTDPFFMLMLMANLGKDYVVWDKAASIRFLKPGRGQVKAVFHLPRERIEILRAEADASPKVEPEFQVQITDGTGNVIAEVNKILYIRKKR